MKHNQILYQSPYRLPNSSPWFERLRNHFAKALHPIWFERLRNIWSAAWGSMTPAGRLIYRPHGIHGSTRKRKHLTVISANLWHDYPRFRNLENRLEAFAHLAQENNADFLLLQEVTRNHSIKADKWLANRLGMGYLYSRTNGAIRGLGFEEGLAIFSHYPLSKPRLRQLSSPANPFARRLAIGATANTPWGTLDLYSTHLGLLPPSNRQHMHHLLSWVEESSTASGVIIGGDFNADEKSSRIRHMQGHWQDTFRHHNPHESAATHQLHLPWHKRPLPQRLDYIFMHQPEEHWHIIEARHLASALLPFSDHNAVLTRLVSTNA